MARIIVNRIDVIMKKLLALLCASVLIGTFCTACDEPYSFSDQIIYSNTTIYGGYEIWANNVTVKTGATFMLQAPEIVINEPLVVEAGAGLVLTH